MEWYKHSTGSHDDPDVSDAMDEFGHVGYSVFFITLEIYGSEFNHLDSDGWLTISKRFLARKLRVSQTKVELILNFYSERQRIITKISKNTISINCPKFVEIASNWTRRKNTLPTEALRGPSAVPTAIEVEVEVEEEVIKSREKRKRFIPPTPDEVKKYCQERKNDVNPVKFIDFYQAKDWMIGKNKMKDWKAAVRTWEGRDNGNRASPKTYAQAKDAERRALFQCLEDDNHGDTENDTEGIDKTKGGISPPRQIGTGD